MTWAIRCEGVSKHYRIGLDPSATQRLSETIQGWLNQRMGAIWPKRAEPDEDDIASETLERSEIHMISESQVEGAPPGHFWALKDLTFDVPEGARVGLIGRNGSGKSTLLKILSCITAPSTGRFQYRGRVVSLLEVGTGFHLDLSGRQNVYLNGALHGMTARAIREQLNQIIDFSELGEHIDSPVKHYSSGMYMRLAFSVAAHLESDILLIDEALSVGDDGFQKKCKDKMLEVTRDGARTLFFVSHDMGAVRSICDLAFELSHGEILRDGDDAVGGPDTVLRPVDDVVGKYMLLERDVRAERIWDDDETAPSMDSGAVRMLEVRVVNSQGRVQANFDVKDDIYLEVVFVVHRSAWAINTHVYVDTLHGERIFVSMDNLAAPTEWIREEGIYRERVKLPSPLFNEGTFKVEALVCTNPNTEHCIAFANSVSFRVSDDMAPVGVRGDFIRPWPAAITRPHFDWDIRFEQSTAAPEVKQVSVDAHEA